MAESAYSIFKLLSSGAVLPSEFLTRDSGVDVAAGRVKLAIDSRGLPVLLVPISPSESDTSDSSTRAIRIETYFLVPNDPNTRTVIFRCEVGELSEQFARLVDDILHSLRERPEVAGATAVAVFERWRSLFEPANGSLLSREAQIGLLAEIHYLERLLQPDRLGHEALSTWCGPDRSRHDFVTPVATVEVKATASREQFLIAIHGAKQLDSPAQGSLHVYAEQFEAVPAGDSLADAVDRVLHMIPDSQVFLSLLAKCGYFAQDHDSYLLFRFARMRSKVCEVDKAFPRIVGDALKDVSRIDRIQRLQYSIDIGPLPAAAPDSMSLDFATGLMSL